MTGGLTFPHPNIEGALLLSRLSRQGGDFDLLKIMDSAEVKSPALFLQRTQEQGRGSLNLFCRERLRQPPYA
jgi:hypothetical protein